METQKPLSEVKGDETIAKDIVQVESNGNGEEENLRLNVLKTYKLYINGKFPRTESGRYMSLKDSNGKLLANICRGSRKDFRNSVVAARGAFSGWAGRSAFNRSQIIYRIAEMLESRKLQFEEELQSSGLSEKEAEKEVLTAIDRVLYYAGWADKYQQVFSAVNPVSSSHFNFSVYEPTGVVGVFAPEENGILGIVSSVIPVIVGGNTCIVLSSGKYQTNAITFAEVLNDSDVPGGVVNILTGIRDELASHYSSHKDVNAMVYCGGDSKQIKEIQENATNNVKRIFVNKTTDWYADKAQNPYAILDVQEIKTTWHPIGT